jgi:hypothetical protein
MICLCCPPINFVCELHRSGKSPNSVAIGSRLGVDCPWDPDSLPDRLRGFGHRMADQDGGSGEEWIWPQEDLEAQMIEAVRALLDAREIKAEQGI